MITDQRAEQANDFIRDNSGKFAKAKSERLYLEQFLKTKKSLLFLSCDGKTIPEKESKAQSHPDYLAVLEGYKIAVEEEEDLKWKITAESNVIDIWRTQQANNRKGY